LFAYAESWSPDGKWLLVDASDATGNLDLWRVPMAEQGTPEIYQRTPEQERFAAISPDGNWVAYVAGDSKGVNSLYVQSFPTPGTKYQLPASNPVSCAWSDRGDELFAFDQHGVPTAIAVSTAGGFHSGASHVLFAPPAGAFARDYSSATGHFLQVRPKNMTTWSTLEVVMGWTALIEQK
jgi:dipeptidyl aminopeptidase/acylaminoacyl peptidase